MKSKSTSKKVALGGLTAALSIALMFITGLIPIGTYAFPVFAGIFLVAIVIEINSSVAWLTYAAVSILSLLLVSDKEAALMYTMFFGFYPILKGVIERLNNRILEYIIKYVVFNICIISAFFLAINLFGIPKDSFNLFGIYLPWVFLIIGEVFFIIYDLCVSVCVSKYINSFSGKIFK